MPLRSTPSNRCRSLPSDSQPVQIPEKVDIPRKPKPSEAPQTNGNSHGLPKSSSPSLKRKRGSEEAAGPGQALKKGRLQYNGDNSVLIEDSNDGAIVIDE